MSKSICIAHGGDISVPSGGTNRITAFVKSLKENGFDVYLVVPSPEKEFSKDLKDIELHTVPIKESGVKSQPVRALLVSRKAKRIAKKNDAILQIEHSTLAGFATLTGCSDFILDMHDLAFDSPLYTNLLFPKLVQKFIYKMERRAVNHASKIIVVSNPMKEFIIKAWNAPEEKIEVIPNGYFEEKFKNFNFEEVEEVDGMISFLGTLHPKLDLDKIIVLAKSLKNSKIYIIGDGPVRGELEKKVRKNNLKNVILTGRLPDKEAFDLVAKSQVTIYPIKKSLHTAVLTSVKLFDYAALGKAMVLDDVSDSEIWKEFKEKKAALFSDPSNPDKFVECVQILLEDKKLRKEISYNAKELVKDYTWEKMGQKLVEVYKGEIMK